jgi:branched-chain amino acid transport system permease protein
VRLVRLRAWRRLPRAAGLYLGLPGLAVGAGVLAAHALARGQALPDLLLVAVAIALVLPMGPLLYRVAFRPIADAPVLVLLIVSVVLHFALAGIALICFGPDGMRPRALVDGGFALGDLFVSGQEALMLAASAVAGTALWAFLGRTLAGKALRATAINRIGARLAGIRPGVSGATAFLLGALLAAISGVLIGPINTLAYDSGFILGLKAFVGAIIGGLASAPGAVLGALFVGVLESFTAFYSSAFKEVVVFALIVPVVVLRSIWAPSGEEFDEEEDRG